MKEENGIGVNIVIRKSGSEEILTGEISDANGEYKIFLEAGVYDIKYYYFGYNPLTLKNVKLISGEIKDIIVKLGARGEETVKYEIDLTAASYAR